MSYKFNYFKKLKPAKDTKRGNYSNIELIGWETVGCIKDWSYEEISKGIYISIAYIL